MAAHVVATHRVGVVVMSKIDEAEWTIAAIYELHHHAGWLPSADLERHRVACGMSTYAWREAGRRIGLRHQRDGARWITIYPRGGLGDPPAAAATAATEALASAALASPTIGWPEIMLAASALAAAIVVILVYAA